MTYRVNIRMTGTNSNLPVFDEAQAAAAACKVIFDNYVNQEWITNYSDNIISGTVKEETIDFISQQKWTDFKAEMSVASNNMNVSQFETKEIISESEV